MSVDDNFDQEIAEEKNCVALHLSQRVLSMLISNLMC
jgi:hypothetical protein